MTYLAWPIASKVIPHASHVTVCAVVVKVNMLEISDTEIRITTKANFGFKSQNSIMSTVFLGNSFGGFHILMDL
jgi:hypothetical protein